MSNILQKENMNRRSFLIKILFTINAFLGTLLAVPVIVAVLKPIFTRNPRVWRAVGNVDDFKVDETVLVKFENAGPDAWGDVTSQSASWLRRNTNDEFISFSINCTHMGCPVRWKPDAELFLCPCHGGVFYKNGSYAAGPPPLDLVRYPVRIRNNKVEILTGPIPITTSLKLKKKAQ